MICQQIKLSNVEIYLKEKGTISFKKKIQTFEFPEKGKYEISSGVNNESGKGCKIESCLNFEKMINWKL